MYIHIHIHIHIHIPIYIHTRMYVYDMYMYICIGINVYIYTHTSLLDISMYITAGNARFGVSKKKTATVPGLAALLAACTVPAEFSSSGLLLRFNPEP